MPSPESITDHPNLLPLPPKHQFEEPFNALVAATLWRNEAYGSVSEAIEATVHTLNHPDTLRLAQYIDELEIEDSEGDVIEPLAHEQPRELVVDADGIIRAIVTDTLTIKATVCNYYESRLGEPEDDTLILEHLEDLFMSDLRAAATHLNGADYGDTFMDCLDAVLAARQDRQPEASLDDDFEPAVLFDVN